MEKEKCPMQGRMSQCKEGECHHQPIEEKWKIEKRALDLVCAIFYYGQFRAETPNEKELESILKELGRWPTSESACVQNTKWWEGQKSFIENLLEQERKRMSDELSNFLKESDCHESFLEGYRSGCPVENYNQAITDALSIINK